MTAVTTMRWDERASVTLRAGGRGLLLAAASVFAGIVLFVVDVIALVLVPLGIGLALLPLVTRGVRGFAGWQRRIAGAWSGIPIAAPYRPRPSRGRAAGWLLSDPATWRDLAWLLMNVPVGLVLGLLPATLLGYAALGVLSAVLFAVTGGTFWAAALGIGIASAMVAPYAGPPLLRVQALAARSLLAPTGGTARISLLTQSRTQVSDDAEAELRRIERDLHDGAQARLAALGISIGMAEDLLRENPDPRQALELLAEAREHSGAALRDLRSLVRGIHPPVLAERGLHDALRALALSSPIPIELHYDVPARPAPPRESALYFAIAELLANVLKHSEATRAWIIVLEHGGLLTARVGDDGIGGALLRAGSDGNGTGLRGVERRLAAFDGMLTIVSPGGGPTTVTLELPCG